MTVSSGSCHPSGGGRCGHVPSDCKQRPLLLRAAGHRRRGGTPRPAPPLCCQGANRWIADGVAAVPAGGTPWGRSAPPGTGPSSSSSIAPMRVAALGRSVLASKYRQIASVGRAPQAWASGVIAWTKPIEASHASRVDAPSLPASSPQTAAPPARANCWPPRWQAMTTRERRTWGWT